MVSTQTSDITIYSSTALRRFLEDNMTTPVVDLNKYRLDKITRVLLALKDPGRVILTNLKNPTCFHILEQCPEVKKASGWTWVNRKQLEDINILRGNPLPICHRCGKARDAIIGRLEEERMALLTFIGSRVSEC